MSKQIRLKYCSNNSPLTDEYGNYINPDDPTLNLNDFLIADLYSWNDTSHNYLGQYSSWDMFAKAQHEIEGLELAKCLFIGLREKSQVLYYSELYQQEIVF